MQLNRGKDLSHQPPNNRVEAEQIQTQQRVGNQSAQEQPDVHQLPRRDAVGDDEIEENRPERREPDKVRRIDEGGEPGRDQDGADRYASGDENEGKLEAFSTGGSPDVAGIVE